MRKKPRASQPPPADAKAAAPFVRSYMIDLFEKEDGAAADWSLISETLFRAAFEAVETIPDDARRLSLLRRVHEGSYSRLTASPGAGSGKPGSTEKSASIDPEGPAMSPSLSK